MNGTPIARFVFVGERQSERAAEIGATWENGRLSAKNLHEALQACGINADEQAFINLWSTPGVGPLGMIRDHDALCEAIAIERIIERMQQGTIVVALGHLVDRRLTQLGLPHRKLTHPAARGAIRKTETYRAHVRAVLLGSESEVTR